MANIIEEILRAAASDDTPQETKDAIREAFERKSTDRVAEALSSDVEIHFSKKKGKGECMRVEGNALAVNAGLAYLIYRAGEKIGGDKDGALGFIDKVCGAAKYAANGNLVVGEGIEDAQDYTEEAEG